MISMPTLTFSDFVGVLIWYQSIVVIAVLVYWIIKYATN